MVQHTSCGRSGAVIASRSRLRGTSPEFFSRRQVPTGLILFVCMFAGALLVESYDIGPGIAGLLLGAGAVAYLPGNFLARRWVASAGRGPLIALALSLAVLVAAFGVWRPSLGVSFTLFAMLALMAGGRTYMGSAVGLAVAPEQRLDAMRLRAAALQFGYLFGSALGGAALAASGYPAVGLVFAALFALAGLPYLVIGPMRGR